MYESKTVTAIIAAAGSGTRMGAEINKVYLQLKDKPVISYSIDTFLKNKYIDEIIVVIRKGDEELFSKLGYKLKTVYGGEVRKISIHNALKEAKGEIVIIHDGARPFVKEDFINRCLAAMEEFPGAMVGVKEKNTVKMTDEFGVVTKTIDRSKVWQTQTPQCFDKELLLRAHEEYANSEIDITDDCMLLELVGARVKVLEGEYTNLKITTKEDVVIASCYLSCEHS